MTPDDLEAIRERVEAATPGPWQTSGPDTIGQWMIYDAEWSVASATAYDHDEKLSNKPGARGPGYIDPDANAEFIAHARTDVPALLAALAEAQRERDEARRLADLTAEQVAANAQIIDEERRLMRPVVEAARRVAPVLANLPKANPSAMLDVIRAVDTYETQTGGTE